MAKLLGRGHGVDIHHLVAVRQQLPIRCPAGLAAASRDDRALHDLWPVARILGMANTPSLPVPDEYVARHGVNILSSELCRMVRRIGRKANCYGNLLIMNRYFKQPRF